MKYGTTVDEFHNLRYLICDVCGAEEHQWTAIIDENEEQVKCPACAFKNSDIDEVEFCNRIFRHAWFNAAGINPVTGEIEITYGKTKYVYAGKGIRSKRKEIRTSRGKFTWEMTDREARSSYRYKHMRDRVFKRDNYSCVKCGEKENLNVHHIKPFKTHKELRFEDFNVITVCADCHKKEHANMRKVK